MNPEKVGKQIIKRLLMEEEMLKTSIYPGAFKPPHKGHVEAALRSIDDRTDKVIIFISTKEREDVDVEEAKDVWELYKANIPELEKVEIHPTPTPVKSVYDYAKDNPTHDIRAVFGKGEEERFKALLDKEKYPHVEVFDAGVVGDFSATNLRKAIREKDLETIKDYIPYQVNVDDFLSIFEMNEGLYPRYDYRKVKQVRYKASDVHTNDPDKLEEADPKKGTGKKPKGSGRRLYTDEDPTDTVKVKFSTRQDIVDTLNKTSFKNKSHARQSQVINLIHQRVRAALSRTKDPLKKARLKSAFEYIKKRKEASKKKTQRLKKQKTNEVIKEIGVKLSNYSGQVLPGDVVRAPKGFPLGGKKLEKGLQLKVIKNSREGVNRYKLSLEDPKTGKKYSVRNFQMDGEYKGEKFPKWSMVRRSKQNIKEDKYLLEARYKKFLNEAWEDAKASVVNEFVNYCMEYLSVDRPKLKLINSKDYAYENRSLGGYSPSEKKIMVVVHNRNMADILRTIAHEMVHHMQNLDKRLTPTSGEDGSPDENEANSLAGVIMRKFGRDNPQIYE